MAHIEAWSFNAVGPLSNPRIKQKSKLLGRVDVFIPCLSVLHACAHQSNANTIHFQAMQPVKSLPDRFFVPACQGIGCGAIPEVVFTRSLPNEVERVALVNTDEAATFGWPGLKHPGGRSAASTILVL